LDCAFCFSLQWPMFDVTCAYWFKIYFIDCCFVLFVEVSVP
jgi:hypothetical protein